MPCTSEKKKEYNRLYRIKHRENLKLKRKQYNLENKEHRRLYRINNKEKINEQNRLYSINQTNTISNWRHRGILCFDFELLYDIYLSTTHCEFCQVELNTNTKTRGCLDHNHDITDRFNIRGILCNSCNVKDVLRVQP